MAEGSWNGVDQTDNSVRSLFSREKLMESDWYKERLKAKQQVDIRLWQRHVHYLSDYTSRKTHRTVIDRLCLQSRLKEAQSRLSFCQTDEYVDRIQGTLGVQPVW